MSGQQDDAGPTALARVVNADNDPTFRTPLQRSLLRLSTGLRRVARVTLRVGLYGMVGATLLGSFIPIVGLFMGLVGFLALVVAAASRTLAATSRLQAWFLGRFRAWLGPSRRDLATVTIVGRVHPLRVLTALEGEPAVFSFLRVMRGKQVVHVYKAEDFLLDDETTTPARVEVAFAEFPGQPRQVFGIRPILPLAALDLLPSIVEAAEVAEDVVRPGDLVEVTGLLEERVDPSAEGQLSRGTPMLRVLSGTSRRPLRVRRVENAGSRIQ